MRCLNRSRMYSYGPAAMRAPCHVRLRHLKIRHPQLNTDGRGTPELNAVGRGLASGHGGRRHYLPTAVCHTRTARWGEGFAVIVFPVSSAICDIGVLLLTNPFCKNLSHVSEDRRPRDNR